MLSLNRCYVEKQRVLHILSVCVCVCSLNYSAHKAHAPYYIVINGQQYFSTLSHQCHDYQGRKLFNIKCLLWFFLKLMSIKFIILRIQRDANINILTSSCKVSFILFSFNPLYAELNPICHLLSLLVAHHILHVSRIRVKETLNFWTNFQKIPEHQIS
jgi:hypothetical protein